MTDFDRAVEIAKRTWYPKDHPLHFKSHHPLGKLLGEWGELLDDYMKSLYKPGYEFDPIDELGDIWYYIRILCYQNEYRPDEYLNYYQELETDYILAHAISEAAFVFKNTGVSSEFLEISYFALIEMASRYNITLDHLTESNWQKLKPGSERGEQWAKARVQTSYIGGKVELKDV